MNNPHYRTDFENMRIPQLQNVHMGITHSVRQLQQKMAADMDYKQSYHNILPRNYELLPIEKCSLHDVELLDDLCSKKFECFWTMKRKEAEQKNKVSEFEAEYKFYCFRDFLNDEELNEFFNKCQEHNDGHIMGTHTIIRKLMVNPHFLEEVMV